MGLFSKAFHHVFFQMRSGPLNSGKTNNLRLSFAKINVEMRLQLSISTLACNFVVLTGDHFDCGSGIKGVIKLA